MSILCFDFETYYDDEYTLKKLTPPEYILDPRYETIGCAVKVDGGQSVWVDGPEFGSYLKQFDPAKVTAVTFNALFDMCILAWRYGWIPARMLCAQRMAVALRGHLLRSASLSNVARVLEIGEKGNEIILSKGKRRTDLMQDATLWHRFQRYACNDADLCEGIFNKLLPEFPASERRVMDRVLRCAIEPAFYVDTDMLRQHLDDLNTAQEQALIDAGAQTTLTDPNRDEVLKAFATSLRSNDQFDRLLRSLGVDVEYKPSTTDPTRTIPAFAKTDEFMANLLEHEDPTIQALANARLGLRSTIERTRGERIMSIASLPWARDHATMPVPLRYSGAHTHRLAGEWKINLQNLPSGRGKQKSKLRKALKAPPGHVVLVADLSQIECRITAVLCGQQDLVDVFAQKKDPYSLLATDVFGYPVNKNDHPLERFIGKAGVLGLGFGCGADKFYNMVLRQARGMSMDMAKLLLVWKPALAQNTVDIYRRKNHAIRQTWYTLERILTNVWASTNPNTPAVQFGPCEIGPGYVRLPNDMYLRYEVLAADENGMRYRYGNSTHRMYGPKFLENIVQALARVVVMHAALRLWDRGIKFKLQAHDELAFIVPEADAEETKRVVLEEMRRPPSWMPSLPLDAEASYGPTYGDAK